jgi:hypothetical protein
MPRFTRNQLLGTLHSALHLTRNFCHPAPHTTSSPNIGQAYCPEGTTRQWPGASAPGEPGLRSARSEGTAEGGALFRTFSGPLRFSRPFGTEDLGAPDPALKRRAGVGVSLRDKDRHRTYGGDQGQTWRGTRRAIKPEEQTGMPRRRDALEGQQHTESGPNWRVRLQPQRGCVARLTVGPKGQPLGLCLHRAEPTVLMKRLAVARNTQVRRR